MITALIIVLLVVFGAATFVLCYASVYHIRRAGILEMVPRVSIEDIGESGIVRVVGKVVPEGQSIRSPMADVPCVYSRFIIEEEKHKSDIASNFTHRLGAEDEDSETVLENVQMVAFNIDDDTAIARVEGKGIDVDVQNKERAITGSLKSVSASQQKRLREKSASQQKELSFTRKMRYAEITIEAGDDLMISGEVRLQKKQACFLATEDPVLQITDKTENTASKESLTRAKINQILAGVTSLCTVAAQDCLIVHLPSLSKKSSSINTNGASNTTTTKPEDNSKNNPNPFQPQPKVKHRKNDRPKVDIPNFDPPKVEPPPVPRNDLDSLLAEVKDKATRQDVFGMKNKRDGLNQNHKPTHPRRAEVLIVLNDTSKTNNVFIKGDCTDAAVGRSGKEDILELLTMLRQRRNVFAESEVLTKLEQFKDPASAVAVAAFAKDLDQRGHVMNGLRPTGTPAEKAVLKQLTQRQDVFVQSEFIRFQGNFGTLESIAALQKLSMDLRSLAEIKSAVQKIFNGK